jgi:hypothetical protein
LVVHSCSFCSSVSCCITVDTLAVTKNWYNEVSLRERFDENDSSRTVQYCVVQEAWLDELLWKSAAPPPRMRIVIK